MTEKTHKIYVILGSAGSIEAIRFIISQLASPVPPLLIAQQLPKDITSKFLTRLNQDTAINIAIAKKNNKVGDNNILLCPGGHNIALTDIDDGVKVKHIHISESIIAPQFDHLLITLATLKNTEVNAIILSSAGLDGLVGANVLRQNDGKIIVQDQATSLIWGLPGKIVERGWADLVLPLNKIPAVFHNTMLSQAAKVLH